MKFSINQQAPALGSVVLLSGILSNSMLLNERIELYSINCNSSSYSDYSSFYPSSSYPQKVSSESFERIVTDFYSDLLAKQEFLGKEFEDVLFNNLWELYED